MGRKPVPRAPPQRPPLTSPTQWRAGSPPWTPERGGIQWDNLPPEKTPVLLVRFTAIASTDVIEFVKERLLEHGLLIVAEERCPVAGSYSDATVCIAVSATQETLEEEAESVGLVKPTREGTMEEFVLACRDEYVGIGRTDFFSQAERAQLVQSEFDFIRVDEANGSHSTRLDTLGVHHAHGGTQTLRQVLEANNLVDCIAPMHDETVREQLMWKTLHASLDSSIWSPVQHIRDYYGEGVALYFVWLDFLTVWLCVPAAVSVLLYGLRSCRGDSIDTCTFTPFYGAFIFVWAVCYLRFYQRHEARWAWRWGTYTDGLQRTTLAVRPEFYGLLRISPVTGRTELYYPHSSRVGKYVVSGCVTVVLLLCAFFFMICSLNFQGYIQPAHDRSRWPHDHDHPFYIHAIAQYSAPGAWFDPESTFASLIPVIVHVGMIRVLNGRYQQVATKLTEWENHETVVSFQNSMILKRFLFEAFDAFIGLAYLAFYEDDMLKLRNELSMVFSVDTFRRVICECLIPMAFKFYTQWSKEKGRKKFNPKRDFDADLVDLVSDSKARSHAEEYPMTTETGLDPYEQFDDLLEMTVQFGYVTLFATAFPPAAVIAVIANAIEIRSDGVKLARVCRKPLPVRRASVGTWHTLMSAIVWLSALSNCVIFGVTSQQLAQFAPEWYSVRDSGGKFASETGQYVVLTIFALERMLIVIGIIVFIAIPPIPEDVSEAIKHRAFVWAEKRRSARLAGLRERLTNLA